MKMRTLGTLFCLTVTNIVPTSSYALDVFGICIIGCVDADVDTSDLPAAAEKLREAAESLGEDLKIATDNLDPLALKKLLDENEELRRAVTGLRSQLSTLPYFDPVVVLQDQELQLVVTKSSGEFELNAWIDDQANWIIQNKIVENVEPVNLKVARDNIISETCNSKYDKFQPHSNTRDLSAQIAWSTGRNNARIKERYCESAQNLTRASAIEILTTAETEFARYIDGLRKSNPTGAEGSVQMMMNQVLGSLGPHVIYISVTPLKANASGSWQLSGEIQVVAKENRRTIKTFDVDHRVTPNHVLGQPLPTVEATITVATPG